MSPRSFPMVMTAVALLAVGDVVAAQSLPLRPTRPDGYPIVPVMEGWWNNGDGSYTVSFGYLNRNQTVVEIPIGGENSIEPAGFSGMQPSTFHPGRHYGVFTVTLPQKDMEVWWSIEANGEETKVPGRTISTAYELDYLPRPHGTVPPRIWFEEGGATGQYPAGIVSNRVETVRVGELLTLAVHVEDVSIRDPNDHRFGEPLDIDVTWYKHQGPPGEIEWVRHPSTPMPAASQEGPAARPRTPPPANQITVPGPRGTALVQARFPAPGDYMLRVRVDQFGSAPDSSGADQCCWTNGYVRVRVTP